MIRIFRYSLSIRLLTIFLVLGILFASGAVLAVRWVYSADDLRGLISGHLRLHVEYVRNDLGDPPRIDRALAISRKVPVDIRISGPGIDWASDPAFPPIAALRFGSSRYFGNSPDAWLNELKGVDFATFGDHRFLRFRQGEYDVVVSTSKIARHGGPPPLLPVIVGLGLVLVLLAYLAVRALFRPVNAILDGAERLGRGDLEHRIPVSRTDELGELARGINHMADDVQGMLDAKRQLLLAISHELRSPLSRMKLGLEFIDDERVRGPIAEEIEEMDRIVTTLLEAERLNTRHAALHLSEVSARSLVERLISSFFSRYRHRIVVTVQGAEDLVCVDEVRVMLMLKNLLDNALRYTDESAGPVLLLVMTTPEAIRFEVRDRGPGIPADQLTRIGQPFYRGDPSRARSTGGTGLGLYLASLVARAHGGSLSIAREYVDGAAFVVNLPRGGA